LSSSANDIRPLSYSDPTNQTLRSSSQSKRNVVRPLSDVGKHFVTYIDITIKRRAQQNYVPAPPVQNHVDSSSKKNLAQTSVSVPELRHSEVQVTLTGKSERERERDY
jgi:hypothetical protein